MLPNTGIVASALCADLGMSSIVNVKRLVGGLQATTAGGLVAVECFCSVEGGGANSKQKLRSRNIHSLGAGALSRGQAGYVFTIIMTLEHSQKQYFR